ncbi:MAG: thermonuclease family protein [Proteobacteria bacterium]|nr:thermonuclease family protein [Pseudomonadota bacterium]
MAAALLFSAPAWGQQAGRFDAQSRPATIEGKPVVLDGDTLLFGSDTPPPEGFETVPVRVRLWGVDAPEMSDWPLGAYARAALDDLLGERDVVCTILDMDSHKRPVGDCQVVVTGRVKSLLNQNMISTGWAVPHRLFTASAQGGVTAVILKNGTSLTRRKVYDDAEKDARQNGRGIWANFPLDLSGLTRVQ